MIKVGLTGGIGSGKTIVSSVFRVLGIPVYNADERSKFILNYNGQVIEQVKSVFGNQAYENNLLDTGYIASVVFSNRQKLEKLNHIVHPAVEDDYINWCGKYTLLPYTIKEAAILFESKANKLVDKTIVVSAPLEIRIERVIMRNGLSRQQVEKRMDNQWPADKLLPLADYVVNNDDKQLILPQILEIDRKLHYEWQSLVNG
ncbi:MAG: dephospho-CoA kinase [Bacteroidales bacterium]|nr:dephospho-CoA kinase [Bacteroidales bacterium]